MYNEFMPKTQDLEKRHEEQMRRRAIVIRMLTAGETNLARIGRKASLTRERVRQIAIEENLLPTKADRL